MNSSSPAKEPATDTGGEVKVLGMREVMIAYENANAVHLSGTSNFCAVMAKHLNKGIGAHVTRLTAERDTAIKAATLGAENLNKALETVDGLRAELVTQRNHFREQLRDAKKADALQSELTKARKAVGYAFSLIEPIRRGCNLSSDDLWQACSILESSISHQSAPAAKCLVCGQEDKGQTGEYPCVACGTPTAHDAPEEIEAARKYDEVLKPFMRLMERELHANSGKGDRPAWITMSTDELVCEIYYHVFKLQAALKEGKGDEITEYAADVANLSMMLTDVTGGLALEAEKGARNETSS